MTTTTKRNARRAIREKYLRAANGGRDSSRQRLTLDEPKDRDARAYHAFMDFTEAQTMFWALSVGSAGDIWAEDYQMDTRVQWVPQIGLWQ